MKAIKLIKGEDSPYVYTGYYAVDNGCGKPVALNCTEDDGTVRRALVCAVTLVGIKELLAKLFGYIDSSGKYTEFPTVDLFLFRKESSLGEVAHGLGFKWIYCGGEVCLPAKPIDNRVDGNGMLCRTAPEIPLWDSHPCGNCPARADGRCLEGAHPDSCTKTPALRKAITPEGIAEAIVGDLTPAQATLKQRITDAIRYERGSKL